MIKYLKIFIFISLFLSLYGCWDSIELTNIFMVTGISLDTDDEIGKIELGVQVIKPHSSKSEEGEVSETIFFYADGDNVSECLTKISKNINRKLFLKHNQVLLIGENLAKKGFIEYLDFFIRNSQARIEVLLFITEGKAKDYLKAKIDESEISGIFLSELIHNLAKVSKMYRVRIIDFMSYYLSDTSSPYIPFISISDKYDDIKDIKISGYSILKNDKFLYVLENDMLMEFSWFYGVNKCRLELKSDEGEIIFSIKKIDVKKKYLYDDTLFINLNINAVLEVEEIEGFTNYEKNELIEHLKKETNKEIIKKMEEVFKLTQKNNTDIFEIGLDIYRFHNKLFKNIEYMWEEVYQKSQLNFQVKSNIIDVGKVIESLEMEKNNEHR